MMNFSKFREKFFLICSGVDLVTVYQCESPDRTKYVQIGNCVLIPSILSLFTGGYAIYLVIGDMLSAICFALVWSWVIFSLDRAIVSNTGSAFNLGIVARFVLALIISLTISEPLAVRFFSDVIADKQRGELKLKKSFDTKEVDSSIYRINASSAKEDSAWKAQRKIFVDETDSTGGTKRRGYGDVAKIKEKIYKNDSIALWT